MVIGYYFQHSVWCLFEPKYQPVVIDVEEPPEQQAPVIELSPIDAWAALVAASMDDRLGEYNPPEPSQAVRSDDGTTQRTEVTLPLAPGQPPSELGEEGESLLEQQVVAEFNARRPILLEPAVTHVEASVDLESGAVIVAVTQQVEADQW